MDMNYSYITDVIIYSEPCKMPGQSRHEIFDRHTVLVMLGSHGSRLHVITADTNEQLSKKQKICTKDNYSKWIKKIPDACTKA
jgi:hypothetical protein